MDFMQLYCWGRAGGQTQMGPPYSVGFVFENPTQSRPRAAQNPPNGGSNTVHNQVARCNLLFCRFSFDFQLFSDFQRFSTVIFQAFGDQILLDFASILDGFWVDLHGFWVHVGVRKAFRQHSKQELRKMALREPRIFVQKPFGGRFRVPGEVPKS